MAFGWAPSVTDEQPAALVDSMLYLRKQRIAAEKAVEARERR